MIKVRFLPYQAHCFAFGGFEIHMLRDLEYLRSLPLEVEKMDIWSRDANFDVLHLWGLGLGSLVNARWAKRSGKKIVVTALVSYFEKMYQRVGFFAKYATGEERLNVELAGLADAVVVLNDRQAEVLNRYYRVPANRIAVIPNAVNEKIFSGNPLAFHADYTPRDFVLCTGNICSRKNQLRLAKACADAGLPLVIIGACLQGEEAYGAKLTDLFQKNPEFLWIKELPNDSAILRAAYHACSIFALLSHREQQPISALEAAAAGKPLLLANLQWAKQTFYQNAALANPKSTGDIATGLRSVYNQPANFAVPRNVIEKCRLPEIGQAYFRLYKSL